MLSQVDGVIALAITSCKLAGELDGHGSSRIKVGKGLSRMQSQHHTKGFRSNRVGYSVRGVHGSHRDHTEFIVRQASNLGSEAVDRSAVPDYPVTIQLRDVETDAESRLFSRLCELRRPHLRQGFGLDHLAFCSAAAIEDHAEKLP